MTIEAAKMKAKPDEEMWNRVCKAAKSERENEETLSNYASSLWKVFGCMRRAYLERTQHFESDDSWEDAAEHGNWVHAGVVDRYKKAGLWRGDEIRGGNSQYNISYRIDLLIKDNDIIIPVEIKSVKGGCEHKDGKFEKMRKKPDEAHLLQLQSYMHFHKPSPYPYGKLLYYNRNTDEVFIWTIDYDEKVGHDIEDKLTHLEMAISTNHLPEASPSNWNCTYCPCNKVCEDADINHEWLSRKRGKK